MSEGEASSEQEEPQDARLEPSPQNIFDNKQARWWEGGQNVKVGESFTPRRLDTPLDKMMRHSGGRRSRTRSDRRGRYIMARPSPDHPIDLALDATLRAAAPFQSERAELRKTRGLCHSSRGLYAQSARAAGSQPGAFSGRCLVVDGGR